MTSEPRRGVAVEIRLASPRDTEALASLRRHVHDLHVAARPDHFRPLTLDGARREVEALLARDDVRILLVSSEAGPVGYLVAMLHQRPGGEGLRPRRLLYVDQIAVKDDHRGQGYGKRLLGAARDLARELGVASVELEVWTFNEDARRFFASQGFTTVRERMSRTL